MGALRPGTDRLHFLSTLHRHFRFRLPLFGPPVLQKDDGGRTRAVQVRVLLLRVLEYEYATTRVLLEYSGCSREMSAVKRAPRASVLYQREIQRPACVRALYEPATHALSKYRGAERIGRRRRG